MLSMWCVQATDCTSAVRIKDSFDKNSFCTDVLCSDKHSWCFICMDEPHAPADCSQVKDWRKKCAVSAALNTRQPCLSSKKLGAFFVVVAPVLARTEDARRPSTWRAAETSDTHTHTHTHTHTREDSIPKTGGRHAVRTRIACCEEEDSVT